MKKVKIKTLLFIVLVSTISCGQNKKENNMGNLDFKEKLYEIVENSTKYKKASLFLFDYSHSQVNIEVLVNDKLLSKSSIHNKQEQGYKFMNHLLSKKNKKQLVKLRITSLDKLSNFDKHNSYFSFNLSEMNRLEWSNDNFENQNYFIKYSNYGFKKDSKGELIRDLNGDVIRKDNLDNLNVFEKEFEFEAEMPFENEALQNSKDLREIDSTILEQKVLGQYHAFIKSVKNKDEDTYWEMYYNKVAYFAKANFFTEKDIDDLIKEGEMYYTMMSYQPIENYEMVFYDEGRLVCFESKSNDLEFKGKSPLIATAVNPNDPKDVFRNPIQFYFYMPKDSNELQIMY